MSDPDPITRLNAALEGRYRIESELGEGGIANVYLADDIKHERKVALRVLKPELAAVVGAERFLAGVKRAANLTHPHILWLFDSGEADSFVFYVVPYIEGEEAVRFSSKWAEELEHGVVCSYRVCRAVNHSGVRYQCPSMWNYPDRYNLGDIFRLTGWRHQPISLPFDQAQAHANLERFQLTVELFDLSAREEWDLPDAADRGRQVLIHAAAGGAAREGWRENSEVSDSQIGQMVDAEIAKGERKTNAQKRVGKKTGIPLSTVKRRYRQALSDRADQDSS
jgi:hypothetical protein